MIDHTTATLTKLSAHQIGNKTNGDNLIVTKSELDISDDAIRTALIKYFLNSFNTSEYYNFTSSNDDFGLNPLYQFGKAIFASPKSFHINTINIAKHLYDVALHPQIKSGDLFVALLKDVNVDNQVYDVIGIFKSEDKAGFIKLDLTSNNNFEINYETGIDLGKIDKACLIYDVDSESGFRLSILDKTNKASEAHYWKDLFLKVKPMNNNFQATKNFLDMTRLYVMDQITDEFELSKPDQIEYLNKSISYFKTHEEFDKREFEKEVFEDPQVIKSFRKFDSEFRDKFELDIEDSFDISSEVVKKQSKVFKSILKLDRNFHIYIHGDKSLIEKGVERDGRKYYKIYYKDES
jgi:hypothetical protein